MIKLEHEKNKEEEQNQGTGQEIIHMILIDYPGITSSPFSVALPSPYIIILVTIYFIQWLIVIQYIVALHVRSERSQFASVGLLIVRDSQGPRGWFCCHRHNHNCCFIWIWYQASVLQYNNLLHLHVVGQEMLLQLLHHQPRLLIRRLRQHRRSIGRTIDSTYWERLIAAKTHEA